MWSLRICVGDDNVCDRDLSVEKFENEWRVTLIREDEQREWCGVYCEGGGVDEIETKLPWSSKGDYLYEELSNRHWEGLCNIKTVAEINVK